MCWKWIDKLRIGRKKMLDAGELPDRKSLMNDSKEDGAVRSASGLKFGIVRLKFTDGTQLDLTPESIVVFAGPNNSGKTLALREIRRAIESANSNLIVSSVQYELLGDADQVQPWLKNNGFRSTGRESVSAWGSTVYHPYTAQHWGSDTKGLKYGILDAFICLAGTEARLATSADAP